VKPFAAAFNHLLAQNLWAQEKLAPFVGKVVQLRLAPATLTFTLVDKGRVVDSENAPTDAVLSTTPTALLRYLNTHPRDLNLITISGDPVFGTVLREVMSQLNWEAEEDLSRVLGDVLAHRLMGFGKAWAAWHKKTLANFAHAAAEYVTEEQALVSKPRPIAQFAQDVEVLRDAVTQLALRIEKLSAR
jgi:ubiquinone biosynthesis protein UbiJ